MSDKPGAVGGSVLAGSVQLFVSLTLSGTALAAIDGTGARVIDGTGGYVIDGTGARVIDGTGGYVIDGTGARVIDGTGGYVIDGTGARVIDGTGGYGLFAADLLVIGRVDVVGGDFISVLGQTVFGTPAEFAGLSVGSTIAVYGELDMVSGAFSNTRIVSLAAAASGRVLPDFLRGTVDSVDSVRGLAVVGGMSVDYTAMLAGGSTPRVGQAFAVIGRNYRDLGVLVADPQLAADF